MSRLGAGAAVAVAPPDRLARALRLPVLVAVTGLLGLAGHVLADGELPPPRLLALGLAVVAALALPLRRREAGPATLTASLLGGQAALHLVLCLCHCGAASPFGALVHRVLCPEDAHAAAWAGDPLRVAPREPSGYLAHAYPGHGMVLAHVAAALAAAWWLRRGETAVHAALRAVRAPRLPAPLAGVVLPLPPRVPVRARARVLSDQVHLQLVPPRRGPPVVLRPV